MTTSTSLQVRVQPEQIDLLLGEPITLEVQVFNASPIVDEFAIQVIGPSFDPIRPEWVVANPPTLALFPNASGASLVTMQIPASSELAAGQHTIGIRVASTTDPDRAFVQELPFAVTSHPAATMFLDPETVTGGGRALVTAVLRNTGNSPLHVTITADDPANALEFAFEELELDLPLDTEERLLVEVSGKRPLIGRTAPRMFTVEAGLEDRAPDTGVEAQPFSEPVRAAGTFNQRPRISGGVLTALAVLLPVAAIIVAALILRPHPQAADLSGPLAFGASGTVKTVEARQGAIMLKGSLLATLDPSDALLALRGAQVKLREAIVARSAISTQQQVDAAKALVPTATGTPAPAPPFLKALLDKLTKTQQDALIVSSSALTGVTDAFQAYCASLSTPLPDCANPTFPLPPATISTISGQSTGTAQAVVNANAKYTSVSATIAQLQSLHDAVTQELKNAGGASASPSATPSPADQQQLQQALNAQTKQQSAQTTADTAKADQAVAEAQLACRAAVTNVGRTILRAPVDVQILSVAVQPGATVKADTAVVTALRTDGRAFTSLPTDRPPARSDVDSLLKDQPWGANCPGSLSEMQALDAQSPGAATATPTPTASATAPAK